jgi:hypothetical protein
MPFPTPVTKQRRQKYEKIPFAADRVEDQIQSVRAGQGAKLIRLQSLKQAGPSNFASGEGGCVADAEFSADRGNKSADRWFCCCLISKRNETVGKKGRRR